MSVINVEELLQEVSPDAPCGEDLEYDPEFGEMTRAAEGKPEQQMGDSVVPAEDPDWRDVRDKALSIFSRTRDLRAGVLLARALLAVEGFGGLSDGLELIKGLIERHWDHVHPQLDPDDDNDPTLRVNTIVQLTDQDFMLRGVREAPLVELKGFGKFSMYDVEIASGQVSAPEGMESPPEMGVIDAAFMECELDELQGTADAVKRSAECITTIESVLTELVGTTYAANLSALPEAMKAVQHLLNERLARRGVVEADAGVEGAAGAGGESAGQAISGDIRSREDVIRVLDKACEYFRQHEPSSPVPLLLQRAKRLVSKDFMEIMRDMAPDGVSQAETVTGAQSED